jgi:erythromycin esterase-like protein
MGRRSRTVERPQTAEGAVTEYIRSLAHPLTEGDLSGYDPLLREVGDARIVLIGEASHGTHEFYRERALITTRLIHEMGFNFVAIEGDWPETQAVNRFVRGEGNDARAVMNVFSTYPTWMWGNHDALHFIHWLRSYNDSLSDGRRKVGFYGLDLYSLYGAMETVINYLDSVDPKAGEAARQRYSCFDPYSGSKDMYAYGAGLGIMQSCENEAVHMLQELLDSRSRLEPQSPDDSYFDALMSAEVARDGERYYRSMYRSDELSWNLRDIHMMDTLDRLLEHLGPESKAVVWEHNTHIGDFRATADAGEMVNVGQLTRERHPGQSFTIGFGSYEGSVTASRGWGNRPERMEVPPARVGSYDNLMHAAGEDRLLIPTRLLRERGEGEPLSEWRGQRAIGVVYHPEFEAGNYVPTNLATRYDAYIHIDHTRAVRPLAIEPAWTPAPLDQTYPTGY